MSKIQILAVEFEDVATEDWITIIIDSGCWDVEHGPDLARWIDDLRDGHFAPKSTLPPHLAGADDDVALNDPDLRIVFSAWLRDRFSNVVQGPGSTDLSRVARRMSVDVARKAVCQR